MRKFLLLSLLIAQSFAFGFAALTDDLQVYYKFDSSSSVDSTVNARNGTDTSISYVSGFIGSAADTTTGKIVIPSFNLSSSYSYNFWINYDSCSGYWFSDYDGGGTGSHTANLLCSGGALYTNFQVDSSPSASDFTSGSWQMVTVTHDGTTVKIYRNGSLVRSASVSHSANTRSSTLFQRHDTGGQMSGSLDEVGIWNRQLSGSEITELYNSGSGLQYPFSGGGGDPPPSGGTGTTTQERADQLETNLYLFVIFFSTGIGIYWLTRQFV